MHINLYPNRKQRIKNHIIAMKASGSSYGKGKLWFARSTRRDPLPAVCGPLCHRRIGEGTGKAEKINMHLKSLHKQAQVKGIIWIH